MLDCAILMHIKTHRAKVGLPYMIQGLKAEAGDLEASLDYRMGPCLSTLHPQEEKKKKIYLLAALAPIRFLHLVHKSSL